MTRKEYEERLRGFAGGTSAYHPWPLNGTLATMLAPRKITPRMTVMTDGAQFVYDNFGGWLIDWACSCQVEKPEIFADQPYQVWTFHKLNGRPGIICQSRSGVPLYHEIVDASWDNFDEVMRLVVPVIGFVLVHHDATRQILSLPNED